jgi:SAM-dependent methyltransferase
MPAEPLDFGPLAEDYDRLRPADENWRQLVDVLWTEGDLLGRRTLDVGCGTGRVAAVLAERGAKVWGVDPSAEMIAQARQAVHRSVGLKLGSAEALPFRNGWFERAVLRLVVHLVDRDLALSEVARVLGAGGRAIIATFRPEHFERIWLAQFFPSIALIDRARFPEPDRLADELRAAGFGTVTRTNLSQTASIARSEALERLRGRYISTLSLLPEGEYAQGLARAERELAPVTSYSLEWAILAADRPRELSPPAPER